MNILQKTLFPPEGFPQNLYLRQRSRTAESQIMATPDAQGNPGIDLLRKDILSTDTFFGSFYLAYWRQFTSVRRIALSLNITGAGELRVFEDTGKGVVRLVAQKVSSDGAAPVLVPLAPNSLMQGPFDELTQPSRIFVEFEAAKPSRLGGLDFVTEQAPESVASLSIGLCTFNQETYFARTLARIADLAGRLDAVQQVYIVNQGAPFRSETIHRLLDDPKLTLVEQRNLGGCGGFTRSILQAQEAAVSARYHLLMDDDIVLDERLIERSLRFLSYTDKDIVLGGGMLDAQAPTRMYECGAFLRRDNAIEPYCHNVDMAEPGQLFHFNEVVKTDYNAWWFCILPLEPTRDIGLPPPVFIRGDDFEYGQRLAARGVPTVTLPGIGVWHEPFYAKPIGWQAYYDMRNRLIFGATYPEKVDPLSTARMVNLLVTPILTHQYMIAALRMKALTDFLDGPDALFAKDAETIHGEVSAICKQLAPETLDNELWKSKPEDAFLPAHETYRTLGMQYLGNILGTLVLPYTMKPRVFMDVAAHPRNTHNTAYVLTNGPRSFHILLKPERARARAQLGAAAALLRRYRRELKPASDTWRRDIAKYRRPEYWKSIFG